MAEAASTEDARKLGLSLRIGLSAVILAIGVVAMLSVKGLKKEPEKSVHKAVVRTVNTYTTRQEPIQVKLYGYGTLRSSRIIQISPEITGRVLSAELENGRVVEQGASLFSIDPKDYEYALAGFKADINRLKAELMLLDQSLKDNRDLLAIREQSRELNRAELERLRRLLKEGTSVSRSTVDAAEMKDIAARERILMLKQELDRIPIRKQSLEASLARAHAQAGQSELSLSRCTVKAPCSGRLQQVRLEAGQLVGPSQVVATIHDDSRLEVEVGLPLDAVLSWLPLENAPSGQWLTPKSEIIATLKWVDSGTEKTGRALLDRVSHVDEATRTAKLVFTVQSSDKVRLLSGMFCRVIVLGKRIKDGMLIPREAVTADNQVGVIENGVFRTKNITALLPQREFILLSAPASASSDQLMPGAEVIISPSTTLIDGQPLVSLPKSTD